MYFTSTTQTERLGGPPMFTLDEIERVLEAIRRLVGNSFEPQPNTVAATLAADRVWSARISPIPDNAVYIRPLSGQLFAVGFLQQRERLEQRLANLLQRDRGTHEIAVQGHLTPTSPTSFTLDTNWLYSVLAGMGLRNPYITDGGSLAQHITDGSTINELFHFTDTDHTVRLCIDGGNLGPIIDCFQRPVRTYGYGIVQGERHLQLCFLNLILTDARYGIAFGPAQDRLRHYAMALANTAIPAQG